MIGVVLAVRKQAYIQIKDAIAWGSWLDGKDHMYADDALGGGHIATSCCGSLDRENGI